MSTVFVRSYLPATAHPGAQRLWERNLIGDNLGNLLYTYAVERQLSTRGTTVLARPTRGAALRPEWMQDNADHLVIPLANAFRWTFRHRLQTLSELVEQLDIPVTVLGVGAQASAEGTWTPGVSGEVDAAVKRFVAAVLDRGPTIGVRGEFTRDYLVSLGFPDSTVEVIGCPSMYLHGAELPIRPVPEVTADSRIALTLSPYVAEMGPIIEHHVARYPRLDYVAQDVHTLGMLLGEGYRGTRPDDPLLPTSPAHPLVAEGRTWMALSPPTWLAELGRYDLAFGTRIHGTIAALLAGTPAYLLAHDSRTLELARYHEIPHRTIRSFGGEAVDVAALAAEADLGPTVAGHAERFGRYVDYLDRHGLRHVFADGESGAAFDEAVAATAYPPVVRASTRSRRRLVLRRPSWTRARSASA